MRFPPEHKTLSKCHVDHYSEAIHDTLRDKFFPTVVLRVLLPEVPRAVVVERGAGRPRLVRAGEVQDAPRCSGAC